MAAATDLDNRQEPLRALLTDADLRRFEAMPPDKPRFAFLHWGQEFTATPGPREQALAARLNAGGVELIIGSHPHRAGALTGDRQQCLAYSLGNFIFDQRRPEVSGALLEVMFFPQGTYFLQLHPLGNLYEENFSARQDAAPIYQVTAGAMNQVFQIVSIWMPPPGGRNKRDNLWKRLTCLTLPIKGEGDKDFPMNTK